MHIVKQKMQLRENYIHTRKQVQTLWEDKPFSQPTLRMGKLTSARVNIADHLGDALTGDLKKITSSWPQMNLR